jgi:glycosyltransferase involved in cell wall biosynthesis
LIYLRLPQTMAMKNLWINRLFIGPSIRRADAIAAVSGATARDVEDLMLIPSEKIRVVHSGVEEDYRPVNKTAARTALKYLLKTDKPVLLSVGTMEPRKNLLGAVEAFSRICHRFPHDLCVVGPPGWKMTGILKKIRRREVYHRIKWLGYVPRPLMPALYSLADVFLFPSFYEGFGLPPLEAMSCGTPVISSNTSCMPETLGDAAIFVDPRDTKAMASAMVRLLSDPVLSQDLAGRGIDWSAHFRWHITGKKMVEIFERASA